MTLVNGQAMDEELVRVETRRVRELLRAEMPGADALVLELRAREWARENVIVRMVLEQAGGEGGARGLMGRVMEAVARPKAKEVAAYYREFGHLFERPEAMRAAHIVKNVDEGCSAEEAERAMEKIAAELKGGAEFGELADRESDCAGDGGALGWYSAGEMVDEFEAEVGKLTPGGVSGVFRTEFGFHVAKLLERRAAGRARLEEVRAEIEEQLWTQKRDRAAQAFIEELRAKAEVRQG